MRVETSLKRSSVQALKRTGPPPLALQRSAFSVMACALITAMPGCQKQTPAGGGDPSPPAQNSAVDSAPEKLTTADSVIKEFERRTGLALPAGSKAVTFSDGGVTDASIGFYEWAIISPEPLALPGGNNLLNLPLPDSVGFLEAKMPGTRIEAPQAAFSTRWQKNEFEFSATCVRAQHGDYLMVQQVRNR